MPIPETVEFLAKLQAQNRIQIPIEIRQRFKLKPKQFFEIKVKPVGDINDESFYATPKPDGRITVPWEIIWALKIKPGSMLRVRLYIEDQE